MNLFMFLLLAVWGFLYVNGRQRVGDASKPAGDGGSVGNDGPAPSGGSGSSGPASGPA